MADNDFFAKMTKDAIDELAEGVTSWRDMPPNVLIMACFGMLTNHLTHKFLRPMWGFVGVAGTIAVGYIASIILKIG